MAFIGLDVLLESKIRIFEQTTNRSDTPSPTDPFPVSVDAYEQTIVEDPLVDQFYSQHLATSPESSGRWWNQMAAVFAERSWYQNLASPVSRIIVVWPGERKEQVAKNIGAVLRWDAEDRAMFIRLLDAEEPVLREGKYFPGQYTTHRHATPEDIATTLNESFASNILSRYTPAVQAHVPLEDTLIIASLIEREASDFANMREVSGVIWNRLFIEMPLQLDATLQYVRGSRPSEPTWWPAVHPQDKFLDSPYNTYEQAGLPPAPIANPSTEAIIAALNPVVTDCLYYFHTDGGAYHCSETYEEHVEKLRALYGQGS